MEKERAQQDGVDNNNNNTDDDNNNHRNWCSPLEQRIAWPIPGNRENKKKFSLAYAHEQKAFFFALTT